MIEYCNNKLMVYYIKTETNTEILLIIKERVEIGKDEKNRQNSNDIFKIYF